jgi:hypothetical protein
MAIAAEPVVAIWLSATPARAVCVDIVSVGIVSVGTMPIAVKDAQRTMFILLRCAVTPVEAA